VPLLDSDGKSSVNLANGRTFVGIVFHSSNPCIIKDLLGGRYNWKEYVYKRMDSIIFNRLQECINYLQNDRKLRDGMRRTREDMKKRKPKPKTIIKS
jgi:hypothetical protein